MIILLLIAFGLSTSQSPRLLKNVSALSESYQQKCLRFLPAETENHASLASLVCGENLTDKELKLSLTKTSLIHIFVISGAHLILLDELLSILKIPFFVRFIFLFIYSVIVGWQPPAVRALVALGTRAALRKLHWHFPPDLMVLIAGAATLLIFPPWWQSLSLLMSWCAALALCWSSTLRIKSKFTAVLVSQCAIFLFMCAPLWGLGALHPLSLLYNILLGPVVSFVLMPLAFAVAFIHPLVPAFDFMVNFFATILKLISEPITLVRGNAPSVGLLWFWVLLWQLFFHFLRLHLYQGRDSR
ncbi:MAG: ComEC/Rec2 family competence protein [Bdellovibrio sp.]|nr:ComEC/Rec2 family competence protein [Bdellovibrio sp.]